MVLFLAWMILIPIIAVGGQNGNIKGMVLNREDSENGSTVDCAGQIEGGNGRYFCLFDEATGKTIKVSDREFMYGALITEVPPTFHEEAMKAQAVAIYTYFSRNRDKVRSSKTWFPGKAEFSINTSKWHYYVPKEKMKAKWGNSFDKYYSKVKEVVDSVYGQVIKDEGDLILAAYHAISSGKTERCCDVFGGDLRYLTVVESPGYLLAPNYQTTCEFTTEEFKNKILRHCKDGKTDNPESEWIKNMVRTDSGMVKEIELCCHKFTGLEVRNIFSLRSADFDIKYQDGKFIFEVRGYGHGVGMSQYGAEYMANQGSDYKQILAWYYPNTVIENIDEKK